MTAKGLMRLDPWLDRIYVRALPWRLGYINQDFGQAPMLLHLLVRHVRSLNQGVRDVDSRNARSGVGTGHDEAGQKPHELPEIIVGTLLATRDSSGLILSAA